MKGISLRLPCFLAGPKTAAASGEAAAAAPVAALLIAAGGDVAPSAPCPAYPPATATTPGLLYRPEKPFGPACAP